MSASLYCNDSPFCCCNSARVHVSHGRRVKWEQPDERDIHSASILQQHVSCQHFFVCRFLSSSIPCFLSGSLQSQTQSVCWSVILASDAERTHLQRCAALFVVTHARSLSAAPSCWTEGEREGGVFGRCEASEGAPTAVWRVTEPRTEAAYSDARVLLWRMRHGRLARGVASHGRGCIDAVCASSCPACGPRAEDATRSRRWAGERASAGPLLRGRLGCGGAKRAKMTGHLIRWRAPREDKSCSGFSYKRIRSRASAGSPCQSR